MAEDVTSHPQIFICHYGHEYDRMFTENIFEYLHSQNISCYDLNLNLPSGQNKLRECLTNPAAIMLGYNAQLDHSHLGKEGFVTAAARQGIPVIQWILDHPSARWSEFESAVPAHSCYLLNSNYEQSYFQRFCAPATVTGVMGGVGPNKLSRVEQVPIDRFTQRPINCLIALGFKRLGRTKDDTLAEIEALEEPVSKMVKYAIISASFDLELPLETHLLKNASERNVFLTNEKFNLCMRLLEEAVQAKRRMMIFETARSFPVLVQSDDDAAVHVQGAEARFLAGVSMQTTLARIPLCRSVLSVSPVNDMIHDRTMNALQAGCVPIVEDNAAHRAVFRHGENALMFRYGDQSLAECLKIVCNEPRRAWEIAQRAFSMRDDPAFSFGGFHNIIDTAARQREVLRPRQPRVRHPGGIDVTRKASSTSSTSVVELPDLPVNFGPAVLMILYGTQKQTEDRVYDLSVILNKKIHIAVLRAIDSKFELRYFNNNIEYPLIKGDDFQKLHEILNKLKITRLNINYEFGQHMAIREIISKINAPYDLTIHNFILACPRIFMYRNNLGYCGEPEILGCLECLRDDPKALAEDILWWRWLGQELTEGAERVICPSEDAAERIKKYFPQTNCLVTPPENPHLFDDRRLHVPALSSLEPMRLALLGTIDGHRGAYFLYDCIDAWEKAGLNIDVTIIGELTITSFKHRVCVTGRYEASQLPLLIATADPHLIFYSQQCVQAYEDTLNDGLGTGIPLLVPDIGPFRERIEGKQWCWLYDLVNDPISLARLLQQIRAEHIEPAIPPEPISRSRPMTRYRSPSEFYRSDYLTSSSS
jgi:hypothetical protein